MYRINYSDGRKQTVGSLAEAAAVLGDVVYCDNGDTTTEPSESELRDAGRILVWANEDDANGPTGNGDDGSHAIAEIVAD